MTIQNTHDKLIKEILLDKQNAVEILKNGLGQTISNILNWKSLVHEFDSFIDEELKEVHSDILFSICFNGP